MYGVTRALVAAAICVSIVVVRLKPDTTRGTGAEYLVYVVSEAADKITLVRFGP